MSRPRVAIVLFNLGGPDELASVKPFLINLFTDPAILRVPAFIRPFLARLIAWRRVAPATENYRLMGGKSPLLDLTREQARDLQAALPDIDAKCFVAMRYWHPFSVETARAVRDWRPEQILLVPLYPHFSTTTTGSSLSAWREAASRVGLARPTRTLCCYPLDPGFVAATAAITRIAYEGACARNAASHPAARVRILFSAHGLPQVIVDQGDPYRYQIEATAAALCAVLAIPDLDWRVCFQSRATPQQWLEPSIEQELRRAAADGVGVLVVPIAFVSDHSETLVELDIEYGEMAARLGIPGYYRAPVQNTDPGFIAALARMVHERLAQPPGICGAGGRRVCPPAFGDCPMRGGGGVTADEAMGARRHLLRLVIFDCDGVLVDSEATANRIVAERLSAIGWPMDAATARTLFLGMTLTDMEPVIRDRLGHGIDPAWRVGLTRAIVAAMAEEAVLVTGAREALDAADALGLPWRIASNSSHEELEAKFIRTGLGARVTGRVHSHRDVGRGKPAPDLFLAAAAAEGVAPAACLVIEDSPPGAAAARAAGMECLGYAPHGDGVSLRAQGAFIFRSMHDIPRLLARAAQVDA